MISPVPSGAGIGTRLRLLLAALDGGVQAAYDQADAEFRPRFYAVFRHLLAKGDTGIGELAVALSVSQPAITQTLGEMRAAGLVALATGPDRRTRIAELTPKGKMLAAAIAPIWRAIEQAATDLDAALPAPLGEVLDAALAELGRHSFEARINDRLERI